MVYIALRVHLQRYTKSFLIHFDLCGIFLKESWHIYIVLNIMKLACVIQIYKSMLPMKIGLKIINILYTGYHKKILVFGEGIFKACFFACLCYTNYSKYIYISLRCIEWYFMNKITDKTSDIIWAMFKNNWKCFYFHLCCIVLNAFLQN